MSFLNFISVAGIALGVMALIVVTGIMTGFGNNLREKIIGTTPHVMVEKETGIRDYNKVKEQLTQIQGIKAASAYIQGSIFIEESGQALALAVRGIEPKSEKTVTKANQFLIKGDFDTLSGDQVIIGKELARYFGYNLGDQINLIAPGSGMAGQKWSYKLTITGIFDTGMADYDRNLILIDIHKAQEIFGLAANTVTGIGVSLNNPQQAREVKDQIYKAMGFEYVVKTWIDINRNLFEALFLEKWGLFIILTLMVLIASFNIISTLIVTVMSKIHDIGILQSIGVPQAAIRRIFTKQGILIGLTGIFWGLVGGFGVSYILRHYVKVPADIYSIDHVPVEIQPFDVTAIVLCAFIISFLATIYPASKAASLEPVEALRYE